MVITLGLLLTDKKLKRLNDVEAFAAFPRMGINIYRIDITKSFDDQKHVDAILHKLIDQFGLQDEECEQIVKWIEKTQNTNPSVLFIDALHNLQQFLKRSYTYEVAEAAIIASHVDSILSVPSYFILPKDQDTRLALEKNCYTVPILSKPQWTTGDAISHDIDIILSDDAIPSSYPFEMVIQQYLDHNGLIYKLYAIQDTIFIEKRYSLPNVKNSSNHISKYTIDRLKICPQSFTEDGLMSTMKNEIIHEDVRTVGDLSMEQITSFIVEIERILQMNLLGVDFIVDSENSGKVYCIDVNLFPSYTGFPELSEVMAKFIINKVVSHRS